MTDLSKLVFDTANNLNKTYLEGIKQGQKTGVHNCGHPDKDHDVKDCLELAVQDADDVGQFQENLIKQIKSLVTDWSDDPEKYFSSRSQKRDWEDFLNVLKREAGQDYEEI